MSVKTERSEFRADRQTLDRIQRAAGVVHEPASEFVRKAALARADEVLRQEQMTLMPAEQFDALMASLDTADPAPRLAEAARKRPVFTRG